MLWVNGSLLLSALDEAEEGRESGLELLVSLLCLCSPAVTSRLVLDFVHPAAASPSSLLLIPYDNVTSPVEALWQSLDLRFLTPRPWWRVEDDGDVLRPLQQQQGAGAAASPASNSSAAAVQRIVFARLRPESEEHAAMSFIAGIQYDDSLLSALSEATLSQGELRPGGVGAGFNKMAMQLSYTLHWGIPVAFVSATFWTYADSGVCGEVQLLRNTSCFFLPETNLRRHHLDEHEAAAEHKLSPGSWDTGRWKALAAYPRALWQPELKPRSLVRLAQPMYDRIDRLHIPFPFRHRSRLWWRTQVASFLMRPARRTRRFINREVRRMQLSSPCIAVHVRHGDKSSESPLIPTEDYLPHIERFASLHGTRDVFVSSDDPEAIALLSAHAEYRWHYTQEARLNNRAAATLYQLSDELKLEQTLGILTTMLAAPLCSCLVCTFSSNVGQVMYTSMLAVKQLPDVPHASLDEGWHSWAQFMWFKPERWTDILPNHSLEMQQQKNTRRRGRGRYEAND